MTIIEDARHLYSIRSERPDGQIGIVSRHSADTPEEAMAEAEKALEGWKAAARDRLGPMANWNFSVIKGDRLSAAA